MNKAITYTNKVSTVTFTFGDCRGVLLNTNGKAEIITPNQADDFIEALKEAGYWTA